MLFSTIKLINAIKGLQPDTSDDIQFDPQNRILKIVKNYHDTIKEQRLSLTHDAYIESINELYDKGFITVHTFCGGHFFSITSKFILRKEYYFEAFTQRFWNGYILGVLSGLTIEAIIYYGPSLLSRLSQWMQNQSSFR